MTAARLLIVDDEATLRDLLRRFLERAGYAVETFSNAEEALERFQAAPHTFALVVTDLTLPGMNGEELLQRMRGTTPGVRGLITSGYSYVPRLEGVEFLQKPFLPQMLADAVKRVLAT
jgi:two-component system C4-dicarboxylate transport response regulator DctD